MKTFQNPDEVYRFIEELIPKLREKGYETKPLEDIQHTAYSTSSEWLGELGLAVRRTQSQKIRDKNLSHNLQRILEFVHSVWPRL